MTKPIPQIQKFMTTTPFTIGQDQPLLQAQEMMSEHRIRHLPVLDGGALVGILTERDVALIQGLASVDASKLKVEDAMTGSPFTVTPTSALDEVAAEMAEKRYGSAVVMQNQKVVGIFTAVDGLAALSELLRSRLG